MFNSSAMTLVFADHLDVTERNCGATRDTFLELQRIAIRMGLAMKRSARWSGADWSANL